MEVWLKVATIAKASMPTINPRVNQTSIEISLDEPGEIWL